MWERGGIRRRREEIIERRGTVGIFLEAASRVIDTGAGPDRNREHLFYNGEQPETFDHPLRIVTILDTAGGITKTGSAEEERRKGRGESGGKRLDGRQMSRATGPCDSFNQSLGCVLPRSRTNYVQSCYAFEREPALLPLRREFS